MTKKGEFSPLIVTIDIIGFLVVVVGAGIVRFAKDDIFGIVGGLVVGLGLAILGISRVVAK